MGHEVIGDDVRERGIVPLLPTKLPGKEHVLLDVLELQLVVKALEGQALGIPR